MHFDKLLKPCFAGLENTWKFTTCQDLNFSITVLSFPWNTCILRVWKLQGGNERLMLTGEEFYVVLFIFPSVQGWGPATEPGALGVLGGGSATWGGAPVRWSLLLEWALPVGTPCKEGSAMTCSVATTVSQELPFYFGVFYGERRKQQLTKGVGTGRVTLCTLGILGSRWKQLVRLF